MLPVHGPRTSTNLFHTIVGAEGVSINNVNLEHLSGVEKDKKDLLTLVSQLENLAKQLSGEREEDKQKIIKRLQGVVKELNSTKLDRKIYNLTWKAYERLLKM